MKRRTAGAILGLGAGFTCWFLLGFMGLPNILIYVSGIWVIEPFLRQIGLFGEINLLIPAFFVCLVSFAFYGFLMGLLADFCLDNEQR